MPIEKFNQVGPRISQWSKSAVTDNTDVRKGGNMINVLLATGTLTIVLPTGETFDLIQGESAYLELGTFEGFSFVSSVNPDSVKLRVGYGKVLDAGGQNVVVVGTVTVVSAPPTAGAIPADGTIAAGVASTISSNVPTSSTNYAMVVQLSPTAPGPVRVSSLAVASATQGFWVLPGQSVTFHINVLNLVGFWAYSVFNPNAVPVTVDSFSEYR